MRRLILISLILFGCGKANLITEPVPEQRQIDILYVQELPLEIMVDRYTQVSLIMQNTYNIVVFEYTPNDSISWAFSEHYSLTRYAVLLKNTTDKPIHYKILRSE